MLSVIFGVAVLGDLRQRYNIAPTQEVLVIRGTEAGNRAAFMRWGLIPRWAKDSSMGSRMINARSETVHEKPAFRQAVGARRCIIPASGFYEWMEEGGKKQPRYLRMKHGPLMGFAGIWDRWTGPGGETVESCSILTTGSNDLIRPFHDRMPVILQPGEYAVWLDRTLTDPEKLKALYQPCPAELLEMYPVSPLVNNPRNDTPDCIRPAGR